jgi:hypothetical protein
MILGQFNMLKKINLTSKIFMVEGGKKIKIKFERRAREMPQNKFLFSFCSFPERRARETSNNKSLA